MKTSTFERALTTEAAPQSGMIRAVSGVIAAIRKTAAERALRRQLGDLDDVLLRDIGLGEDEIYRLRQGSNVHPRNWR